MMNLTDEEVQFLSKEELRQPKSSAAKILDDLNGAFEAAGECEAGAEINMNYLVFQMDAICAGQMRRALREYTARLAGRLKEALREEAATWECCAASEWEC